MDTSPPIYVLIAAYSDGSGFKVLAASYDESRLKAIMRVADDAGAVMDLSIVPVEVLT